MRPAPRRRAGPAALLLGGILALTACGGGAQTPPEESGGPVEGGGETMTSTETTPVVPEGGFTNPVYPANFPDPQVVADGEGFLAVATNGNAMNVQTLTSPDLVDWQQGQDALPVLPSWSTRGKQWAPEIVAWPDGTYRLYYTTPAPDLEHQCVSVAVADTPAGPYTDDSAEPFLCEIEEGGSIDASPFVASDGRAYLYWKNDGNHIGVDTYLKVAPLSEDGLALDGEPTALLQQDLPWEGLIVEAPFVWEHEGTYHLFYSGNGYWTDQYAVGHATAESPTGPFTKDPDPVLTSNEFAAGPGHCSLIEVDGQVWMVYHAWEPGLVGDEGVGRQMWLSRVTFGDDGSVEVEPPTAAHPQRPLTEGTR